MSSAGPSRLGHHQILSLRSLAYISRATRLSFRHGYDYRSVALTPRAPKRGTGWVFWGDVRPWSALGSRHQRLRGVCNPFATEGALSQEASSEAETCSSGETAAKSSASGLQSIRPCPRRGSWGSYDKRMCRAGVIGVAGPTITLDHPRNKSQRFNTGRIDPLAPRLHSRLAKYESNIGRRKDMAALIVVRLRKEGITYLSGLSVCRAVFSLFAMPLLAHAWQHTLRSGAHAIL